VFDCIQVIENSKLTGTLLLTNDTQNGSALFNEGRIVDAESGGDIAETGCDKLSQPENDALNDMMRHSQNRAFMALIFDGARGKIGLAGC